MDGQNLPPPPPTGSSLPAPPSPFPPPPPGERPLPMRPMGVGEIVDAAIKLYRTQWKGLLGIAAIVLVPLIFLQTFFLRNFGGPFGEVTDVPSDASAAAVAIIGLVQSLFVRPLLTAAVARASADAYLGHAVQVWPTLRFALTKIHSILWISLLAALAVVGGFIALVVPGIILLVRLSFGTTILIVERRKGSKALGRSWRLSQGHFWRLLGTLIVATLMVSIVASVLTIPANLAFAALGPGGWPIAAVGESIATVLTTPFATLVTVLLYFDLRIRKEAFDLEVMAQEIAALP
jgi:hypothetical protein